MAIQIDENYFPTLEDVFGYIDYFTRHYETLDSEFTIRELTELKEILTRVLHYIIGKTRPRCNETPYHQFWRVISEYNRNVSIVTCNYDTLIDETFDPLYPELAYLDYCIPLMNYNHIDALDPFEWWINPRLPVPIWNNSDPKPIKLVKVHGSLNWKYCNCCKQILLTPWNIDIDLNSGNFSRQILAEGSMPKKQIEYTCPLDKTPFQTLLVPPTNTKTLIHPHVSSLFLEAQSELRAAKTLVIIGYSLPSADSHIRALVQRNAKNCSRVFVINEKIDTQLRYAFKPLHKNIEFIQQPFANFLADENGLKKLLTTK